MNRRKRKARDGARLDDFDPVLRLVRTKHGTAVKLADALGLSRPAIWRWRRVPAEYVMRIESVMNIPRHRIRPDIYPKARERI